MSNYISDAVSERVAIDINAINASVYDLQELRSEVGQMGLDTLITDMNIPAFFQFCINKGFIVDTKSTVLQCLKYYIDYITDLMIDALSPDYDPEEETNG